MAVCFDAARPLGPSAPSKYERRLRQHSEDTVFKQPHQAGLRNSKSVDALKSEPVARCMCCDSSLQYPPQASCFRCAVCLTVNDLRPLVVCSKAEVPLILERIRSCPLDKLVSFLKSTFCRYTSLCQAFSARDMSKSSSLGLSLHSIWATYDLIGNIPEAKEAVVFAIDSMLKRIGGKIVHKQDMRGLVVVFECPWFGENGNSPLATALRSIQTRLYGIISNLSSDLHHSLVGLFVRHYSATNLAKKVRDCNACISRRLAKYPHKTCRSYGSDWQIKSTSRVVALLFASNGRSRHSRAKKVSLGEFYNNMVDYVDLAMDFDTWEQQGLTRFSFCQYPFLMSMASKISILEYDARRQKQIKACDAFFSSIFQKQLLEPHLTLHVRRECLIEDSLNEIGKSEMELKKGLRIEFIGEDGVDAGGLRKEWFMLLCREVFDMQYGMFTYDEDSRYCYFSPMSFESSSQYFLIGVVLGLAIYNSTILDVPLLPAVWKKVLGRPTGFEDLEVYRPVLARGLRKLLEYDGEDVEDVFGLDFVAMIDVHGVRTSVPLCSNGASLPVTWKNRHDYVRLYTEYILNDSVAKQFEPFKRGFHHVCGGNALSLLRYEELELLVRGSSETLDVRELQSACRYKNERPGVPVEEEIIFKWFWQVFGEMNVNDQRRILSFVTGSDRVPAMGAGSLQFSLCILGDDCERFPVAHTCFNELSLYRYSSKQKLKYMLARSVSESEGFGLK